MVEQLQKMDQLAESALRARNYETCHHYSLETLKIAPESPLPYYRLAIIASEYQNYAKAVDVVQRGIQFDNKNPDMFALLAKCQLILNHQDEARKAAESAIQLDISKALTLDTLGVVFSRLGEHEKAIKLFRKIVEMQPKKAEHYYNLGSSQQFLGHFDDAEKSYEKAIQLKPDYFRAHSSLSQLKKQTAEKNHCTRLQSIFKRIEHSQDVDAKLHIGHALAKEKEDIGEYRESFNWLKAAKKSKLKAIGYSFQTDQKLFDCMNSILDSYTEVQSDAAPAEPIFILGMPRTGTTLVERIVASDTSVFAAGELSNFALLLKRALGTSSEYVLDTQTLIAASNANFSGFGDSYIESTRPRTGHTARFIDKMPLNFFYAPYILKALPNACIVCVVRNPVDTCLSNYRQLFSTKFPYYNYAYDLKATARYVVEFNHLVDRYSQILGSSFSTINYDKLVADPAVESKGLMTFLGLDFKNEYLEFYKNNKAPVSTASSVQVRKPIYSSSSGRWKKYGDLLDPVLEIFEKSNLKY